MALKRIAALLGALCFALPAAGTTLDVRHQSLNVFETLEGLGSAIIGGTAYVSDGQQRDGLLYAGGFQLMQRESGTSNAYAEFMAFCVEISTSLRTSFDSITQYTTAPDLFDPVRSTLVATLFQEVYDASGSAMHQGAFQLALWKLTHGDVSDQNADGFDILADSSITNGILSFARTSLGTAQNLTFDDYTPGTLDLAQGWLDNLSGAGLGWSLTGAVSDHVVFLSNGSSQNLVAAAFGTGIAPIPLPPTALLSGAGVVALLLLRRRSVARRE